MLTGPDFREEHVLDDGTTITLRHIRPDDAAELRRGFRSLSPASRYRRFLSAVHDLNDDTLHYLTHVDGRDHVAIVAVIPAVHADRGLGIARFVRSKDDPHVAEAAITVIDPMQHKGLGRILGLAIARAAIERGVTSFRGEVLTDNEPVRQLLDEVGAHLRPSAEGSLVFDVSLVPEESDHHRMKPLDALVRRFLRAAASFLGGRIRGPSVPPEPTPTAHPSAAP